jgi:hypothetical protein
LLIQLLESELTPEEICTLIGECSASNFSKQLQTKARIPSKHVEVESGVDGCDVCVEVVTLAESALAQNKTEEEIEALLHELCACESVTRCLSFCFSVHLKEKLMNLP